MVWKPTNWFLYQEISAERERSITWLLQLGLRHEQAKLASCYNGIPSLNLSSINVKKRYGSILQKRTLQRNLNYIFPEKELRVYSFLISTFMRLWVIYVYSHVRPAYFPAAGLADRSEEYINLLQKHECWNRDCSLTVVPFLGIFVSNFRYWVFAV